MRIRLVAVVMIVLVVVAGCGGGKKKSAVPPTSAPGSTATTTTAASAPTFASTKNCRQLAALGAKISQAIQSSAGSGSSSIDDEAKAFKAMASAAPAEIRGDFETFASAFTAYAQALAKVGLKPGKAPTPAQMAAMATMAKSFSAPKLLAAERHLAAWAQKNCGVGTTTTG